MRDNFLLRFPPEIRNLITEYVLSLGDGTAGNVLIACPPGPHKPLCEGLSILSLCKQLTIEARSMLEARTTAYIPIMADMNFCKLVSDMNENGNASLPEIQSTVFAGLTSFRHAHFYLHVKYHSSLFRRYSEPDLSEDIAHIYDVLKQAFRIWRAASEHNFAHLKEQGLKRKAILHLDHLFSDWRDIVRLSNNSHIQHLFKIMTSDTTTDCKVHYYVLIRGERMDDHSENWRSKLLGCRLNYKRIAFRAFPGIKLIPEVYGELH